MTWFGETFATAVEPKPDPDRDVLNRLVTARAMLIRLSIQIGQLGEHRQPGIVARAQTAISKTIKVQLARLRGRRPGQDRRQCRVRCP